MRGRRRTAPDCGKAGCLGEMISIVQGAPSRSGCQASPGAPPRRAPDRRAASDPDRETERAAAAAETAPSPPPFLTLTIQKMSWEGVHLVWEFFFFSLLYRASLEGA